MSTENPPAPRSRPKDLESLGPRGEGWVGLQSALGLLVLVVAPLTAGVSPQAWSGLVSIVGVASLLFGIGLFVVGGRTLGRSFSIWVKPRPEAQLHVEGIYRWMRHPICAAQVFIGIGWALAWGSLVALALMPVYIWYLDRYKLAIEERWLSATYPAYGGYRESVRHRMIPWPPGARDRGG